MPKKPKKTAKGKPTKGKRPFPRPKTKITSSWFNPYGGNPPFSNISH